MSRVLCLLRSSPPTCEGRAFQGMVDKASAKEHWLRSDQVYSDRTDHNMASVDSESDRSSPPECLLDRAEACGMRTKEGSNE